VQADSELRRRHPDRKIRPLESAEPNVPDEPTMQPGWLAKLNQQRRVFRQELEARQNVMVPNQDPGWEDEGPAWSAWQGQRDPILQPPKRGSGLLRACWKQSTSATPSPRECKPTHG
jgi:hypothetical protein